MNRVLEFRREKKLSQLALAEKIGVARQTINLIENGKYNPSLELCLILSWTIGSDLISLFWREKNE